MIKKILGVLIFLSSIIFFISCSSDIKDSTLSEDKSKETTSLDKNKEILYEEDYNTSILDEITSHAKIGQVINSNYIAGKDIIDSTIKNLGKEDSHNYVQDAKGTYYNYSSYNLVLGCNKGGIIFEVRSFDPKINILSLTNLQEYYGEPDYESKTKTGEKVIGYEVNSVYNILFVLKNNDDINPKLDHYSILCPKDTTNNMSGDPGRQW